MSDEQSTPKSLITPGPSKISESAEPTEKASWYWDENTPGQGDRPDWLKQKYNKVVDQAKGYPELEKMLGQTKAPESYDLSEYGDHFDLESTYIAELTNAAKESRLSQDILKKVLDPIKKYHDSLVPNMDEEIKKLGEHANSRLNAVNVWASNTLSDKAIKTLGLVSQTAEVFELFDEIRQAHSRSSRVPSGNEGVQVRGMVTADEVRKEIQDNYARYKTDPKYRAEISGKLKLALGDD